MDFSFKMYQNTVLTAEDQATNGTLYRWNMAQNWCHRNSAKNDSGTIHGEMSTLAPVMLEAVAPKEMDYSSFSWSISIII